MDGYIFTGCCLSVIILVTLALLLHEPGLGQPRETPDPNNGMRAEDVRFHAARGTLNDARIIETAARLNQQGVGREMGYVTPVRYQPGADYQTQAYARWIYQHHPDKLVNPGDLMDDMEGRHR